MGWDRVKAKRETAESKTQERNVTYVKEAPFCDAKNPVEDGNRMEVGKLRLRATKKSIMNNRKSKSKQKQGIKRRITKNRPSRTYLSSSAQQYLEESTKVP